MRTLWLVTACLCALCAACQGSALVLKPEEFRGARLYCNNAWDLIGLKTWNNLTLRVLKSDFGGLPEEEDVIQISETSEGSVRIQAERQVGGHIIYLRSGADAPADQWNRRLVLDNMYLLENKTKFLFVQCFGHSKSQVKALEDYIEEHPNLSVVIRFESPSSTPMEALFDSWWFQVSTSALVFAHLVALLYGTHVTIEYVKMGIYDHVGTRRKYGTRHDRIIRFTVVVTETFVTFLIGLFLWDSWNRSRPGFYFGTVAWSKVMVNLFFGTSLSTTILVWKIWDDVLQYLRITQGGKKRDLFENQTIVLGVGAFPFMSDVIIFARPSLFSKFKLLRLSVIGVLMLSTLVVGILYARKAQHIIRALAFVGKGTGPSLGGDSQSVSHAARIQAKRLSRLGRVCGFAMVLSVAFLAHYAMDPSIPYKPAKMFAFLSGSTLVRLLLSITQIRMCRLPPRLRKTTLRAAKKSLPQSSVSTATDFFKKVTTLNLPSTLRWSSPILPSQEGEETV